MNLYIAIEGGDGSGKTTQAKAIVEEINKSYPGMAAYLKFPNYSTTTGKAITEMLSGKYGKDANKLNTYGISTMYSIDRFCSFNDEYKDIVKNHNVIVSDRSTISNLIHQGSRFLGKPLNALWGYADWLFDLEFSLMENPEPDMVIYLYVSVEKQIELLRKRDGNSQDINEQEEFLKRSTQTALICADRYKWNLINCMDSFDPDEILPKEEITKKIMGIINRNA